MSPTSSTRLLLQTETRRPSTIRTTMTSLTSRKSHARTLDCSVLSQCVKSLFRTFLMVILFLREREREQRMHASGNRCKTEREEREDSVISVAESMSKKSRRNSIRKTLFRLTENSILMNEISEKIRNEELNKPFLVKKTAQRKLYLTEYDLEIHNLERRNSEYALIESRRELESQGRQLLEANQCADQAHCERLHLCSELEVKDRLHQECHTRSCQEIDELRNAAIRKIME